MKSSIKLSNSNEGSSLASKAAMYFRALVAGIAVFAGGSTLATMTGCGEKIEALKVCNTKKDCDYNRLCIANVCVASGVSTQEKVDENQVETSSENNQDTAADGGDEPVVENGPENRTDRNDGKFDETTANEGITDASDAGSTPETGEPSTQPEEQSSPEESVSTDGSTTEKKTESISPDTSKPETTPEPTVDQGNRPTIKKGMPGWPCKDDGDCKPLEDLKRACVCGSCGTLGQNTIGCQDKQDCLEKIDKSVPASQISCVSQACKVSNGSKCHL